MKRRIGQRIPISVVQSLRKFGDDIRAARIKRDLTGEMVADLLGVHRTTFSKMEAGDPMVGLGLYASALYVLGFGSPLSELVDPRRDEIGLLLDLERMPKRVRVRKSQSTFVPLRLPKNLNRSTSTKVLKIGVLGAMSGPYALWGLVSKYAAQATADMYNEKGGVEINGDSYQIEIMSEDDHLDPKHSVSGLDRLTSREGIHYIIGPNVDQTIASVAPIAERKSAMLFPYSFTRSYYSPPYENTVLGQIAGYQAWPLMYKYLRDRKSIRSLSIIAPETPEGSMQRRESLNAASKLGLRVVSDEDQYKSGDGDFRSILGTILRCKPDLIVLPNLAPSDAPRLIQTARSLGFEGLFATEAAQDINVLNKGAGSAADGLITLGGASTPSIRSSYMDSFIKHYCDRAGVWNDEAGTKAYALELILETLRKSGKGAIDNINLFKSEIPTFEINNPFLRVPSKLKYVGSTYFNQKRQIGVPLVVNAVNGGKFETLLVANIE